MCFTTSLSQSHDTRYAPHVNSTPIQQPLKFDRSASRTKPSPEVDQAVSWDKDQL